MAAEEDGGHRPQSADDPSQAILVELLNLGFVTDNNPINARLIQFYEEGNSSNLALLLPLMALEAFERVMTSVQRLMRRKFAPGEKTVLEPMLCTVWVRCFRYILRSCFLKILFFSFLFFFDPVFFSSPLLSCFSASVVRQDKCFAMQSFYISVTFVSHAELHI